MAAPSKGGTHLKSLGQQNAANSTNMYNMLPQQESSNDSNQTAVKHKACPQRPP